MEQSLEGSRSVLLVSGTLIVACLCAMPASGAQQDSSTAAPTRKAPTTKSTHPTTKAKPVHPAHSSTTSKASSKSTAYAHSVKHSSHKKVTKVRGQQKIDSERARSIQEALIREHYLTGEPSGTWNEESEEAMRRYQSDHGWQIKEVPDSRALIKLGLGPSHDHLLNPESAMTSAPDAPRSVTTTPVANAPAPAAAAPPPTPTQGDPPNPQ